MSYIGSTPTTQSFIAGTDYFNGNGSTVNFTLSRSVNSVNDIEVIVNNVEQIPSGYSVSGTTLTFSAAPSAGTSNVYVRYLSTTNLSLAIPAGTSATFNTVTATSLTATNLTVTNGATIQGLTVGRGAGAVSSNTAVGASAFSANTTGKDSVALGNLALRDNTTGIANLAIGSLAMITNTTGGYNTAIGNGEAGVSQGALGLNTTGSNNTGIGYQALRSNTTASRNTAVGFSSATANTTGTRNTGVGAYSLYVATTGNYNTAVGDVALESLTTGSFNTAIGIGSGAAITTGSKNTILGGYTGNQGGLDIRTASNNIVLSDGDGNPRIHVSSGGQVDFRGIALGLGGTSPSIFRNDNSGASGFHFTIPGALPTNGTGSLNDNVMPLGGGSNRMSVIFAGTGTISTSDENEKQDIEMLSEAEMRVAVAIKGLIKKFRWKDAVATKGEDARIHVGVIAQEVQAAFEAENLSAEKYALFCSDTWHEFNGSSMDADGNRYTAETEGAIKRTRLGVRYEQLLAFVIAAL